MFCMNKSKWSIISLLQQVVPYIFLGKARLCCGIKFPRGVLKFGFGRHVPLQNLKVDPYKYQFARKSDPFIYQSTQFGAKFWAKSPNISKIFLNLSQFFIYQSTQFGAKFWAKSLNFSKIFLNLSQLWLKFGKIWKNQPIYIPQFALCKRSFLHQEADFATHVGGTSPFCTEYPPGQIHIPKSRIACSSNVYHLTLKTIAVNKVTKRWRNHNNKTTKISELNKIIELYEL